MYPPSHLHTPYRHPYFHGFSDFGDGTGTVLASTDILNSGQSYTFTFTFPFFSYSDTMSDITAFLSAGLAGIATVTNVTNALFSSNVVVTIVPVVDGMSLADFVNAFATAWQAAPWYMGSATFVQAQAGTTSSQAGGIASVVTDITSTVGSSVGQGASSLISSTLTPLMPYLLIGGAVFLLIMFKKPAFEKG